MIVAVWAMFRQGPVTSASAETAASRPAAQAQAQAQTQEVRSVAFDGRRLMLARLRGAIATRPGVPLDADRLRADREAMERMLADLGYLAARVEPAAVTFDAGGAAYVSFAVDQGPMFHLRNIEITGGGRDATVVTLSPGDDAARGRIERARQELAEALGRRGRSTQVELSVKTDVAAAAVDVVLATR